MKPDQAAEFSSARRLAFKTCWTKTLIPAPTVSRAGQMKFCMMFFLYRRCAGIGDIVNPPLRTLIISLICLNELAQLTGSKLRPAMT